MRFLKTLLDDGWGDWRAFEELPSAFQLDDIFVSRGFVIAGWLLALVPVLAAVVSLVSSGLAPH